MVGYLNTVPLLYGLQHSNNKYTISLDIPAKCYMQFKSESCDVALLPVGVLPLLSDHQLITNVCIGCNGDVRTVCIFSHLPIEQVSTIHLDNHSRTSVLLARMLIANHWSLDMKYISSDVNTMSASGLRNDEAVLMIGDKVFEVENDYEYKYDLGKEWKTFTGLPFAFAVWVAKPHVTQEQINQLSKDLNFGIENTAQALAEHQEEDNAFDLEEYFKRHIDYHFDDAKKEALHLYLQMIGDLPNPSF